MPFKPIGRGVFPVALISFFSFAGCSYFFNTGKQEFSISYKSHSDSCITRANKSIKNYFDKTHLPFVSETELDQFKICYQEVIESFVKHSKSGRLESENYSAENIALFFRKFYSEAGLSLENIQYYLSLKYFLINGQADALSKKELLIISDSLTAFTELLKAVLPYRSVYFKKIRLKRNKESYDYFSLAFRLLKEKTDDFLRVFKNPNEERNLDLRAFIQFFLDQFEGDDKPGRSFNDLNMIMAFKNLVTMSEGDILTRGNLAIFVRQSLLAYEGLMRFDYFVKEDHLFTNIGGVASFLSRAMTQLNHAEIFRTVALHSLSDIVEGVYQILSHPIQSDPSGQLSYGKLHNFLISLEEAGILGTQLMANTLSLFMRRFSEKWLDPASEPTANLTMPKLLYVKKMYSLWFQRQQVVNTLFSNQSQKNISLADMKDKLKNYEPLENWIRLFNAVAVHQWEDKNRMILSKKMDHFSYREMTVSNSIALLSEIFTRPYNLSAKSIHEYEISREEVQEVYEILRILGVPLGFMDSRLLDTGYRVFDESNNFSTQLSSNDVLNFYEVYEYLSFNLSSFQLGEQFYQGFDDECLLDYVDVHNSPVVRAPCFLGYLKENFDSFFEHLKTISQFWEKASDVERDKFMGTIEYIAQGGFLSEAPYQSGEIRTITVSLYYLESVFFTFDNNRDGIITGDELRAAQFHFHNFTKKFLFNKLLKMPQSSYSMSILADSCNTVESDIKTISQCLTPRVFLFMLASGNLPTESIYHKIDFLRQLKFSDKDTLFDNIQAGVHDVFRFFSMINRDAHESFIDRLKMFLLTNKQTLYSELSDRANPDCTEEGNQNLKFCQWARMIRCNDIIQPYLYKWMGENKYRVFPEKIWEESPEQGAIETMKLFSSSFYLHQKFSVHCFFPEYKGKKSDFLSMPWLVRPFVGDKENRGLKDNIMDY